VLVLLAVLCGCGGGAKPPPAAPQDDGLARLDQAVAAVDVGRAAVLAVPGEVVPVLTAFDDADEAATRGDRSAAGAAQAAAQGGRDAAEAALTGLPARLSAYRDALTELEAAAQGAQPLDDSQRAALGEVAVGGRQEAAAVEAAAAAAEAGWPAYDALGQALETWQERARAGWYRTTAEAVGGYGVLAAASRPALDQARSAFARTDAARQAEIDRQNARLDTADAALAPLRAPG
jgi:hypothetical protein